MFSRPVACRLLAAFYSGSMWKSHFSKRHGLQSSGLAPRPLKAAVAQPLVQQKISAVPRPVERLNPIRPAATKQEQAVLIQLCTILLRNNGGQSVDPAAQIGVPAGNIVPAHMTEVYHTV